MWDADASVLTTTFDYPEPAADPRPDLQRRLDERFGIEEPPRRLILGPLEVTFLDPLRLETIELRTNPGRWHAQDLPAPVDEREPSYAQFVVAFDQNHVASIDAKPEITWDRARARLVIRFGSVTAPPQRYALADRVGVTVDGAGQLVELQLDEVFLSKGH